MQPLTRRSFIRWVITSGVAAACPIPLPAAEPYAPPQGRRLAGESNEVCHKVRDGVILPEPPPSRTLDAVIVGGGPAGVAAADALAGSNFLVLEKEAHVGGNAYAEDWNGLRYCTGSAWLSYFEPNVTALFKKWKLEPLPIAGFDAGGFEGKWIRDFWDSRADSPRIDELPYGESVKRGFRDFLRELDALDLVKDRDKLDAMPFSELLRGKPEPLVGYFNQFGMSNWGADVAHSSAYLGAQAARDWPRDKRYTFEGGLGVMPQRIFKQFAPEVQKRFLFKSAVYQVKREGKKVLVRFFSEGKAQCVEAKTVIFCAPKLIAARTVAGLPPEQIKAMEAIRYAPYPVYNLCFSRRVADIGYDNFLVGAKNMTDVIQADWVTRRREAKPSDPQVLTIYAPMRENERADLLDDEETVARAERAVRELLATLPKGAKQHLEEVRIFRRGHPMPVAQPGWYTKMQEGARADFPPVYFAHCDAVGDNPDMTWAMSAALEAAKKAAKHI